MSHDQRGYLKEEKSMIHSFTVTFRAKYLTAMITNVTPYETCSLIKNNILHQSDFSSHYFNLLSNEYVGDFTIPNPVIRYNKTFLQADQPIRLQYSNQIKLFEFIFGA
jgi:hypothetical protein